MMSRRWNKFSRRHPLPPVAHHGGKEEGTAKRRFSITSFVFGGIRRMFTLIGGMIVLFALFGYIGTAMVDQEERKLPPQMALMLTLDEGLKELPATGGFLGGFEGFGPAYLTTRQMIDALDHARVDPRVRAVIVNIQSGAFGISQVQELRAAVKRFNDSGKKSYAYSSSYAEAGGSMGAYYLASAFGEIWMQPVGMLSLPGFDAEMPFVLDGLEKIGISPQFFQRKEYKSAMESFTRTGISEESREMTESILNNIIDIIAQDIANDRGFLPEQIRAAVNQGLFTDKEAAQSRLIDRLDYSDALIASLREEMAGHADDTSLKIVSLGRYARVTSSKPKKIKIKQDGEGEKPLVGLVYAAGNIVADDRQGGFSSNIAAANKISAAIMRAARDTDIHAVLLRIDSPGGSPTASETIRRAVEYTVSRGKPVIVSMGSVAGSGGYWIATDATRIFALPSTLTGSIGVISGKFTAPLLMEKIGVNWDGVQIGENADMWSFTKPFSESGQERMHTMIDNMYEAFIERVSKGRNLSPEMVENVARGRIWTGQQALSIGLVDMLGGFDDALDYTAQQIGAEDRAGVEIVELPRPKTAFDRIFEILNIEVVMKRIIGTTLDIADDRMDQARMPVVRLYDPMLEKRF